jgi:hypothetical protein
MSFDPQTIFGNLAEKEKIKGHHSPEGRAIRTLSRALNGWANGALLATDVLVLCDQSIEDWLKARLKIPAWSVPRCTELLALGVEKKWLTRLEAVRLQRIHNVRSRVHGAGGAADRHVEQALEFCIQLVERHW